MKNDGEKGGSELMGGVITLLPPLPSPLLALVSPINCFASLAHSIGEGERGGKVWWDTVEITRRTTLEECNNCVNEWATNE